MKLKLKTQQIVLDWNQFSPEAEMEFVRALRKLGVHMINHPQSDGLDEYDYILSNRRLTVREFAAFTGEE